MEQRLIRESQNFDPAFEIDRPRYSIDSFVASTIGGLLRGANATFLGDIE